MIKTILQFLRRKWIYTLFILLLLISTGIHTFTIIKYRKLNDIHQYTLARKIELTKEVEDLNKAKDKISNELSDKKFDNIILSNFSIYLADKFDEIEAILIAMDDNSVGTVNWLQTNCLFYGDTRMTASYMIGQYQSRQNELQNDYWYLRDEMLNKFKQYE